MDLSISSLYANIDGYLKKMSKGKRIALAGVIAFVLVGSVILAIVLNSTGFTVLYRGLSPSEGIEVVNLLDSAGINYKLQNDGTILVPKDNEAKLKMQLAAEGFPKSTLGYDMFTSQTDLMTTDYEKKQYLIFQLQDRLQDSLKTLEGVKNAIVTLSVADSGSFVLKADKPKSSASVVLDLYSHTELTKKQIKGIEELVAKSVPGLMNENVVIVNNEGMVLNVHADDGTELALSQVETINKINELYKEKIVRFLEPVFGKDGMSVAVSVQMDFKKKTSEQTTYTPVVGDQGIVAKERFDRQSTNGGVLARVAGTESNTGVPTYEEEDEELKRQSSANESGSNEYLINKLIEGVNDYGGRIVDMTVSVMINSSSLSNETVNKYREMVAFGAGIAVDKVIITYEEFLSKPAMAMFQDPQTKPFLGLTTSAFIFIGIGVFILLLVIVILAQRKKEALEYDELDEEEPVKPQQRKRQMPGEIVLTETHEQGLKRQVKEFASANPETVAQLLRTWMKEETVK